MVFSRLLTSVLEVLAIVIRRTTRLIGRDQICLSIVVESLNHHSNDRCDLWKSIHTEYGV